MSFVRSFFLALSNSLSFLEPFKDSFSADLLSLSLSHFFPLSFHNSTSLLDTANVSYFRHQSCPFLNNVKTVLV